MFYPPVVFIKDIKRHRGRNRHQLPNFSTAALSRPLPSNKKVSSRSVAKEQLAPAITSLAEIRWRCDDVIFGCDGIEFGHDFRWILKHTIEFGHVFFGWIMLTYDLEKPNVDLRFGKTHPK